MITKNNQSPYVMPRNSANSAYRCSQLRGFTFTELLVVIGISLMLAFLAVPSLIEFRTQARAEGQRAILHRTIIAARTSAIKQSSGVTFCPLNNSQCNGDWTGELTLFIDENMNLVLDGNDRILTTTTAIAASDQLDYPRQGISFRPDGSLNGFLNGTFTYCPERNDHPYSIGLVVNQAGRVRAADGPITCAS